MVSSGSAPMAKATFAGGCFWCMEPPYDELDGVISTISGYTGGTKKKPTYEQVSAGTTGHAEAVEITYDPKKISYDELLEIFWKTHDPTTLNKQGADEGTQYRSVIYYHNDQQKQLAEHYKKKLDSEKIFNGPIVTEISPATTFYKAEDYHQNYYNLNQDQPYCSYVITPKLEKFRKVFKEKAKKTL